MPISLVRALTENASTPAMPTAAMITARMPNDETSAAFRRRGDDALVLDLRHGHHVLDRSRRRDAPDDARRRGRQRRDVAVGADHEPAANRELLRERHEHRRAAAPRPARHPACSPTTPTIVRQSPLIGRESQHVARPRDPFPDRVLAREELVGERLVDDHDPGRRPLDRSWRTPGPVSSGIPAARK